MKNILVIGSINMDMVIDTPRIPQTGESVFGTGFKTVQGGKGANQAIAVSRLGNNVRMIGCVGNDVYGDELINSLHSYGVDTTKIKKCDCSSGIAVITVCDGNNSIIAYPGANDKLEKSILEENEESFKWADIVILQFEMPIETVISAARKAKRYGSLVILNPAPMKEFDKSLFDFVDILIPNSIEAGQLLGRDEITLSEAPDAIEELRKYGIELVIITMGKEGSVYNCGDEIFHQKAFEIDVVDTTAAGDSFIGGLCTALCNNMNITDAISYATAVSTLTVSRAGASISIPDKKEVENYIAENL